jgi:hypothetical protein
MLSQPVDPTGRITDLIDGDTVDHRGGVEQVQEKGLISSVHF